jgi:RNA recognition motif-containing protein
MNNLTMSDPVGEDAWLAFVDEASRIATELEQRIGVLETYQRAVATEPFSKNLWLSYCEYYWSLYQACQNDDAGWSAEDQELGREMFTLLAALDLWSQGVEATKYRINDSHEIWVRWMSIQLEQLEQEQKPDSIELIKELFLERLQIPHATWDETSQMFSRFTTKYDENEYESTMTELTRLAKPAKDLYHDREIYELKLIGAQRTDNKYSLVAAWKEYLDWEQFQSVRKVKKGVTKSPPILCVALFERALCSTEMGPDAETWEDYIAFLSLTESNTSETGLPSTLSVTQRAVAHCPFSGTLRSRYILCAEASELPIEEMERIKTAAFDGEDLDRDGMEAIADVYMTWATFLKRKALSSNITDQNAEEVDKQLSAALKAFDQRGQRKYGRTEWKGDPSFRIERIIIEYKTQRGLLNDARHIWESLAKNRGGSYEFWQQYYIWEMAVRDSTAHSSRPTEVLKRSLRQQGMDWPEKLIEIYLHHCRVYEGVDVLLKAMDIVHKVSRSVAKRRAKELAEAGAVYGQQNQSEAADEHSTQDSPSIASKRKRETESGETEEKTTKKSKNVLTAAEQEASQEQNLKRDRENTTVIVMNLPPEVTQTKVRQYFQEYGHINSLNLKAEPDNESTTAVIELRSPQDVQSALLRDMKYFVDRQIRVEPATGLTLYVCNYPPTADEAFFRKLFKDCGEIFSIRWPSLKFKATRRFAYITFRTKEAAAAATKLDGVNLGGNYKLSAKFSNPGAKKERQGAMAEEREVHVTGIDFSLTEADLKEVFGKYGTVERVRLLEKLNGESKGAGFISFKTKEEATAALDLDKTKLKSRVLTVERSMEKNYKPTTTIKGTSMSPAPDADGDSVMSTPPATDGLTNTHAQHAPARTDYGNRIVTLMNIPDTVNDARVRAIVEPYGTLVKLILRPDHQGAIVEYEEVASAGKAALGLEGHEIVPGRKLRTGGMKDLFAEKSETKVDKIVVGKEVKQASTAFIQPAAPIRRPGAGGRGGLGKKRGLGFAAPKKQVSAVEVPAEQIGDSTKATKSNADFRALFESSKKD